MALRNSIDTVAWVSLGQYTETYVSSTGQDNMNSLYASLGMLESAPAPTAVITLVHAGVAEGLVLRATSRLRAILPGASMLVRE